jgi:hypothetical protein
MLRRVAPAVFLVPTAFLILGACSIDSAYHGGYDAGIPQLDTTVGGVRFHLASGTAKVSGGVLGLYLSDQANTCQAISGVPVSTTTTLALRVAPGADGGTSATVVAPKLSPGAGEAVGSLAVATGGQTSQRLDAASGTVAWTQNTDLSVTITSLDVGFSGTTDRLALPGAATVPPCQ